MRCEFEGCAKELRSDNTAGYCKAHFNHSPKAKAAKAAYREANRNRLRAYNREWGRQARLKDPEGELAYKRAWQEANREKCREYTAKHRQANLVSERERERLAYAADPVKFRTRARARRQANPERMREIEKAYRTRNPERVAAKIQNRRAREQNAEGEFTEAEWAEILELYEYVCPSCGRDDVPLTVDHVVPLDWGGSNWGHNLQPLCGKCNSEKGARHATRYPPRKHT